MFEDNFDKNFKIWTPHQNVDEVYDLIDIRYNENGEFIVSLTPDHFEKDKRSNYNIKLVWDCEVISYTVTEESYRPELWGNTRKTNKVWGFYISESSDYLNKFREKNYIVPEKTYHFFIGGTNVVVDILASEYPKVIFEKK